jgi:hypothetical protein
LQHWRAHASTSGHCDHSRPSCTPLGCRRMGCVSNENQLPDCCGMTLMLLMED